MKEYVYKPKAVIGLDGKEKENAFDGEVVVKIPTYTERLRLIKQLNFKVNELGEIVAGPEQIDSAIRLVEVVKKYLVRIDVTARESGEKFNNVEDLEYYQEGADLLNEVGNLLLSGIRMSKN